MLTAIIVDDETRNRNTLELLLKEKITFQKRKYFYSRKYKSKKGKIIKTVSLNNVKVFPFLRL